MVRLLLAKVFSTCMLAVLSPSWRMKSVAPLRVIGAVAPSGLVPPLERRTSVVPAMRFQAPTTFESFVPLLVRKRVPAPTLVMVLPEAAMLPEMTALLKLLAVVKIVFSTVS